MNNTVFIGRLVDEPTIKKTNNGTSVCSIGIAVDDGFGDAKKTYFPKIVFWKHNAEYLCKYGKKGSRVALKCRYTERTYQDKNGNNAKACEFVADTVNVLDFADSKSPISSSTETSTDHTGYEVPNIYADDSFPDF